ncbi:hypothetical protein [Sorangium sp. So ce513]|uniref:hypothetical protein n=1 Tax=Sorangium sp. So ce513 TaxID=3133315 RepID=UPI003F61579B
MASERDTMDETRAAPAAPAATHGGRRRGLLADVGRWLARALGAVYLASILLTAVGSSLPERLLPRTALYFTQIARLFPYASLFSIDHRAEGFRCSDRQWVEIDTRPYFPINADDKENRFYRAMHFFRQNRPVLQELDGFLVARHNARLSAGITEGTAGGRIGGVRLSTVRFSLPEPGQRFARHERRPLDAVPEELRKVRYYTPQRKRSARCKEAM